MNPALPDDSGRAEEVVPSVQGRPGPRRLHLHVGLPKSGTTSIQSLLRHHRDELERHGFCYPGRGAGSHFLAALEVTGKHERWGRDAREVRGTFRALLDEGIASGGDVVISHEIFGQAKWEQVPDIVAATAGLELHVVLTVRSFEQVVPAAWQEWVKNGKRGSFEDFVDLKASRLPGRAGEGELFWRLQNVVEVLDRWGQSVPADRIHVVTCPPPGAPADTLWKRFADAIDFPADVLDLDAVPRANESIGAAQVTFLRRVNAALDGRLPEPHGERLRKHWLAQRLLSAVDSPKAVAPPRTVELFAPVSKAWADEVARRGHPVHGDLADLLPSGRDLDAPHPDETTAAEQLEGLDVVVAEMLLRIRETEERAEAAEAELRALRAVVPPGVPSVVDRGRQVAARAAARLRRR